MKMMEIHNKKSKERNRNKMIKRGHNKLNNLNYRNKNIYDMSGFVISSSVNRKLHNIKAVYMS